MSHKITCVIVDDEPDAAELLSFNLGRLYQDIAVEGIYFSWRDALNALRQQQPDILFLDISLPEKNGIDMLQLLPEIKCEIIFTTAYAEYALEAFQFFAIGYLLKPLTDKPLTTVVDKAIERIMEKKGLVPEADSFRSHPKIGIPNRKGIDYVNVNDILYLESASGYTRIALDGSELLSSHNLGTFKKLLESSFFYLVHRSYIINLNYIVRYQSEGYVVMSDKKEIPVSKNLRDDFLAHFFTVSKAKGGA